MRLASSNRCYESHKRCSALWPVQVGTTDHHYWTVKYVVCFFVSAFFFFNQFFKFSLASAHFKHFLKAELAGIFPPCRRELKALRLLSSLRGTRLPCSAFVALRWFLLHMLLRRFVAEMLIRASGSIAKLWSRQTDPSKAQQQTWSLQFTRYSSWCDYGKYYMTLVAELHALSSWERCRQCVRLLFFAMGV